MKDLIPFLCIGTLIVVVANGAGLDGTDPPVNYTAPSYTPHTNDTIIRPYQPFPQIPRATAAASPPAGCPDYGAYNGTLMAQMSCEMVHQGGITDETLRKANQFLEHCPLSDPRCN